MGSHNVTYAKPSNVQLHQEIMDSNLAAVCVSQVSSPRFRTRSQATALTEHIRWMIRSTRLCSHTTVHYTTANEQQ